MENLRWVLVAAGLALVAGIYGWELIRRRRRRKAESGLDDTDAELLKDIQAHRDDEAPLQAALEGLDALSGNREEAGVDVDDLRQLVASREDARDGAPIELGGRSVRADVARPRAHAEHGEELILSLAVMAEPGQQFSGDGVRWALEAVDMRFGDMKIFHHYGVEGLETDEPIFSLANILEPGFFDLDRMGEVQTPGLVMFMRLPGPLEGRIAFELMVNTGQRLAERLGGELRDETRSVLTTQGLSHLRERIAAFDRRQLAALE